MTRPSRRSVLAASTALFAAPAILRAQNLNSKLNIAAIAVGGRGGANLSSVASENITALCDVNAQNLAAAAAKHPKAKKFADFRELFDKAHKDFDAVVVSTCEHTHA
ncbi:MAG: gfo/Idh/MocA family oxidoreductase, partial [Phycisphaerae bacterium]